MIKTCLIAFNNYFVEENGTKIIGTQRIIGRFFLTFY